jgi:hypothetical protein
MKNTILTIIILISTIVVKGQTEVAQDLNAPIMTFKTEHIDYGTIKQGSNGEREFHFTNTGKSPLIISEAKKTCGCTVPTWPKQPIKPGESGVIKVKYDTKRLGNFSKSVTIVSNAKRKLIGLSIAGKIVSVTSSAEKDKPIIAK